MGRFVAYFKTGSKAPERLGTYATEGEAIERCVRKVDDLYSSEAEQSRRALQQRGYYCVNWSSNEVYIEEEK